MWLLRKLFLIKEIKSRAGELHFQRWRLFWTPWFALCIHFIYKADEDEHMHNHPWILHALILYGGYKEETSYGQTNNIRPGNFFIRFNHEYHRVVSLNRPVSVSLVCMIGNYDWGYLVDNIHVPHQVYRKLKNELKLDLVKWDKGYSYLISEK